MSKLECSFSPVLQLKEACVLIGGWTYDSEGGIGMNDYNNAAVRALIIPIAQKYGVERILLFGSMAREDADENSDYDFLISKGNLKSLIQYMSFVSELESALNRHVDVVSDTSSDDTIIENARREGILLYER